MSEPTFEELCDLFSYTPKNRPLDSEDVAAILNVHVGTVHNYRLRGEGPRFYSPPGTRRVWYSEKQVLAWLASGETQSTSEAA